MSRTPAAPDQERILRWMYDELVDTGATPDAAADKVEALARHTGIVLDPDFVAALRR